MIHYTCDRCRKIIETEHETRYSVVIETKANGCEADSDIEERDHLMVIEDIINQLDDPDCELEVVGSSVRRRSYDLCANCHEAFTQNPLNSEPQPHIDFSDN
ncbi:MAG: hypothetical protein R3C03_18855 [Pirellulaceae bacterium]